MLFSTCMPLTEDIKLSILQYINFIDDPEYQQNMIKINTKTHVIITCINTSLIKTMSVEICFIKITKFFLTIKDNNFNFIITI